MTFRLFESDGNMFEDKECSLHIERRMMVYERSGEVDESIK